MGTINAIARISARSNPFFLTEVSAAIPVCNRNVDVVTEVPGPYGVLSAQQVAVVDAALLRSGRVHVLVDRAGVLAARFRGLVPGHEVLVLPSVSVVGGREAEAFDAEHCNP